MIAGSLGFPDFSWRDFARDCIQSRFALPGNRGQGRRMVKHPGIPTLALAIGGGLLAFVSGSLVAGELPAVLESRCFDCHGEEAQKSGLRLDSLLGALKGGDSGEKTIVPGKSAESYLISLSPRPTKPTACRRRVIPSPLTRSRASRPGSIMPRLGEVPKRISKRRPPIIGPISPS